MRSLGRIWTLERIGLTDRGSRPIDVALPSTRRRGRRHRAVAAVDGHAVWFESADRPLAAATEAFGAAFLVPALGAGRPLRLAGPVCDQWALNLARLTDEFRRLWYPAAPRPLVVPARPGAGLQTAPAADGQPSCPPSPPAALCFSGGVDAFHALLASGRGIETLVTVVGYDVRLRDRRRATAVTAMARQVAAETAAQAVVVSTNLRRHPLLTGAPWLRAFGGPLAAIGHLLAPAVGRILVASDGLGFEHPEVGSRPSTDPLHGSATLAVEHVAAAVTRLEKIRQIAGEPIVQRQLRVCWQNDGAALNCGRCEKCVRTMLALDACGTLGRFAGFGHGRGLVAALDGLPAVDVVVQPFYRELLGQGLSVSAAAAVDRLLDRSDMAAPETAAGVQPTVHGAPPTARRSDRRSPPRSRSAHRLLSPAAFAHVCEPLVGRRVGYVRPEGNVGDHLIEVAMIHLFAEYGIGWRLVSPADPGAAAGLDLLVFGGGGNMGTRYPGNHALRTQAVATGLPLVILPQSFTSPEDQAFEKVFVRERVSLALRPDGVLAPDLALGLATLEPPRPDRDLGVYLRRDQERGGRKPLFARDPVRLFRDPFAYLAFAARHRRIVTDRLHFAVAGLHAGRDVTLVANDYHKNRSMHETWLAELGCRFAATSAEALGRRAA
jgi:hypothetical protein